MHAEVLKVREKKKEKKRQIKVMLGCYAAAAVAVLSDFCSRPLKKMVENEASESKVMENELVVEGYKK